MAANREAKDRALRKSKYIKRILIFINIILILAAVIFSALYSNGIREEQKEAELNTFESTIESMKQISMNYLTTELNYAKDWANYIDAHHMTVDEALDYIREANHQSDRYAHIVDMNTFAAYSTYQGEDAEELICYRKFHDDQNDTNKLFINTMHQMYSTTQPNFSVLGKYRTEDTHLNVISVGTKVRLVSEDGVDTDYLLLRVIPVESVRNIWIFPVEYPSAEVGIITRTGDYVVQSSSMKSRTFAEFIRGYNFADDYTRIDKFIAELSASDQGILEYADSRGQNCYWYYSNFGEGSNLDILGYIPVADLNNHKTDWTIVLMTCGILAVLALLDGVYFIYINRKLREAVAMAESASQAKTRFLSTMSHDIRTPMNAIIGMTELAKKNLDHPTYMKECLDKVSLAGDHLLTLVNDILDISKVESGSMVLVPVVFSLNDVVEKVVDIAKPQIEEKQLHFKLETDISSSMIFADELRMSQIFINILTNAVKYTQEGGHITVSVKETEVKKESLNVVYQVSDDGAGMSEEFQADMYKMFERGLDSRINQTQGTGLGLAIVKQMVELMNGTIVCDSALGRGTTFTVTLPLEKAQEEKTVQKDEMEWKAANTSQNTFEDLRVLVAEDNDLNWEIIQEMLKSMKVTCERAKDGRQCVERLQRTPEHTYDLVFMDVHMPVMDGKEATQWIRKSKREDLRKMLIIAMTADAFAENVQECLDAGMDEHIAKPIDFKKVLMVLRHVAQKNTI